MSLYARKFITKLSKTNVPILGLTAFCLKLLSLSCFIEECVGDSLVAQMVNNLLQCGRPGFDPWLGKVSWRRKWQTTPVLLENPMDRGTWQATVHGVTNSWTQ